MDPSSEDRTHLLVREGCEALDKPSCSFTNIDNLKDNPMILVVGKDPLEASTARNGKDYSYKASIVDVLLKGGYDVKETTGITGFKRGDPLANARRWISKNSLRRLDRQNVKVICAMDSQGCYGKGWVKALCLIFEKHSPCVAAVRKSKDIRSDKTLKNFFSDFDNSIVLEDMDDACLPHLECIIEKLEPFIIKILPSELIGKKDLLTPWSSENLILFGRTGSGKSTIAQMLTRGCLNNTAFKASSNARGMTKGIEGGEGRGWYVTDTPGFGEASGGTVSKEDAIKIIKDFIIRIRGVYSHYLYVWKNDRVDMFDERLWKFFKNVFAGAEENFTVLVTSCNKDLSEEDKDHLKKTFIGCKNFIYVDNPPVHKDSGIEVENEVVRGQSLQELEDGLAELGIADIVTSEGEFSTESKRFVKSRTVAKFKGFSNMGDPMDAVCARLVRILTVPVSRIASAIGRPKIDDEILLLPL